MFFKKHFIMITD